MNPKNIKGKVMLRSANPQDTPDINMGFFSKGDDEDLQAMFEATGFLQLIFKSIPNNIFSELHSYTHVNYTDSDQKEFLQNQIFSHHVRTAMP